MAGFASWRPRRPIGIREENTISASTNFEIQTTPRFVARSHKTAGHRPLGRASIMPMVSYPIAVNRNLWLPVSWQHNRSSSLILRRTIARARPVM